MRDTLDLGLQALRPLALHPARQPSADRCLRSERRPFRAQSSRLGCEPFCGCLQPCPDLVDLHRAPHVPAVSCSLWQLSTWRSLARQGKLAVASSAEPVDVGPQPQPAFATLEVDSATGPIGSVVIESREVTVRLDGAIDASRVAEIASALRGLR